MPVTPLPYPLVQGFRYDHSSLDIKLSGVSNLGVKALDWNDGLTIGKVFGTAAQKLAETRGQYDGDGSLELWTAEAVNFEQQLVQQFPGIGLYEMRWTLDVNFASEGGLPPMTVGLVGVRILKRTFSTSASTDAHSWKYDLSIMYALVNGVSPITGLRK